MIKKIALLYFLFLGPIAILVAQNGSISGLIKDEKEQVIEFANILVQSPDNQLYKKGDISKRDGNFNLEVPANADYKITISFIGYETWETSISIKEKKDLGIIQLNPTVNELGKVVVTAERNIITQKEDKLVFNVAVSPLNSGYDGLEVLERSPNIFVDTEGNILMRNESPTVMINGRISNLSGTDLANYISNLRSENIQSIEIQTHLSANTDGENSGGLINIILKKKQVGFDGSLRTDYTFKGAGYNSQFAGGTFNYGAEKWNIYGNYNYTAQTNESRIKQTFTYFDRQEAIRNEEAYKTTRGRHNYRLGFVGNLAKNHVIGLEGYTSNYDYTFENDGNISFYNQENLVGNANALAIGGLNNQLYTSTFNYAWTMDTLKSNLKIFVDYANQAVDRYNTTASTYSNAVYPDNTERNNGIADTKIFSTQADVEKYFQNGLKLETGLKLTNTARKNGLLSDVLANEIWTPTGRTTSFDYTEQVTAAYLAFNKKLGEKDFLEIGIRVENTDLERVDLGDNSIIQQNYTNWFPTLFYSRTLAKNRSISLSYSKRLRRPPFYFLNNTVVKVNDFRYELGNPDLIPENVHNLELSWKDKKQNINLYIRNITEAINGIYYLEEQIAYYQKFNEGIQRQIGLSYNRFGNITNWWSIRGIANVYHRKFINQAGQDSFERTTLRLNLTNNFQLNKTTTLDLIGSYISPSEDAYYIAYERFRVNLMLQKTFINKRLKARVYLNDVFNTLENNSERPFKTFKSTRSEKWRSQQLRLWISYNFNGKTKINKRQNKSKNDARRRL